MSKAEEFAKKAEEERARRDGENGWLVDTGQSRTVQAIYEIGAALLEVMEPKEEFPPRCVTCQALLAPHSDLGWSEVKPGEPRCERCWGRIVAERDEKGEGG